MEAQKKEIIEVAEKHGWKVTQLDNYDFRQWSMETWLLKSIWTPLHTTAYVSFLIDPMSDFQKPYAWAIEASAEKPVYGKERDCFVVSLKQWKNEKDNFLNFLSGIRAKAEVK